MTDLSMAYFYLALAIAAEVIGTLALKASNGFSHAGYNLVVIIAYIAAFYCLGIVLKTVPVGIAYALWAGLGIVLITLLSLLIFKQVPDLPAMLGMSLIIAGVLVINLFSKTTVH